MKRAVLRYGTMAACVLVLLAVLAACDEEYKVTYQGNSSTHGSVPVDNKKYEKGDTVTVLGRGSGAAAVSAAAGHIWMGWNTASDGSGTRYNEGDTFTMPGRNVTLYAETAPASP